MRAALESAAHDSRKRSKASELWFRKCGHGERLHKSYYSIADGAVPVNEWSAFEAVLRRKLPVTTLLYALGLDQEGIMDAYYDTVSFRQDASKGCVTKFYPKRVRGTRPSYD